MTKAKKKIEASHKDKLRRLRILLYLESIEPSPVGERALLNHLLTDPELEPSIKLVRQSLQYLASVGLVRLVKVDAIEWLAAAITPAGSHWLELASDGGLDIYSTAYEPPELPAAYHGRTSSVDLLPVETRSWIDQQLLDRNFSGYTELTNMLQEQGLGISRSSIGRYAKQFKSRVTRYREKSEMVKSLAGVFGDDAPEIMQGAMGTALVAVMDAIEDEQYSTGKESLSALAKTIPALGKGFRDAERHKIEQETRKRTIEEAADVGEDAARALGLDDEQAKFWRDKFLKGL